MMLYANVLVSAMSRRTETNERSHCQIANDEYLLNFLSVKIRQKISELVNRRQSIGEDASNLEQ